MKFLRLLIVLYCSSVVHIADVTAQEAYQINSNIQTLVTSKIDLIKELLGDANIQSQINAANIQNEKITMSEILKFDGIWREEAGVGNFVKFYLTNPCSERLLDFQDQHSEFAEIFLTDLRGLNVCQTNKTSDWYQADEEWWVKTYASGKGLSYSGQIEYDESAHSESIPIFIPIYNTDKSKLIGVTKASVNITSINLKK